MKYLINMSYDYWDNTVFHQLMRMGTQNERWVVCETILFKAGSRILPVCVTATMLPSVVSTWMGTSPMRCPCGAYALGVGPFYTGLRAYTLGKPDTVSHLPQSLHYHLGKHSASPGEPGLGSRL